MPECTSEDRYFDSNTGNHCAVCGAGLHNSYQHDANCLINLPRHSPAMVAEWHSGKNEYPILEANPSTMATPGFDGQNSLSVAYHMGRKFARSKANAERTTRSLEQAVDIAHERTLKRQGNGDSMVELT